MEAGIYESTQEVNIRKEPKITWTNIVGRLQSGTQRTIHEFVTDDKNQTWGRISEPDSAGISQWVCVQSLNRTYMKPVNIHNANDRLSRLEAWARIQGYKG